MKASLKLVLLRHYRKLIFVAGLFFLALGLTLGGVRGVWDALAIAPTIVGFLAIGFALVTQQNLKGLWGARSTQAGTNALAASIAVFVLLGSLIFLSVRFSQKLDLTENQLFTLAPQTQQLVRGLKRPVKVLVFDRALDGRDRELLANYQQLSPQFSYELVDPAAQLGLTQTFGVKDFGESFLVQGETRRPLKVLGPTNRLTENDLTNAIEQMANQAIQVVYFLQGHGERPLDTNQGGMSQAIEALKGKNYEARPLNLAQVKEKAIPQDAVALAIVGPQRPLLAEEIATVTRYLDRGGRLLALLDPKSDGGLKPLLATWGLKLDDRLIIDSSQVGQLVGLGPDAPLVTKYGQHPITASFRDGISFYPVARSLEIVPNPAIDAKPLIRTNDQTWAESNPTAEKLAFDPATDRPGPLVLGAALSKAIETKPEAQASPTPSTSSSPSPTPISASPSPSTSPSPTTSPSASPTPSPSASPTPSATAPSPSPSPAAKPNTSTQQARLVVIGNSAFAADGVFGQQLNGDVFLNSVGWLSDRAANSLSLRPREPSNRRLAMTPAIAQLLLWVSLILLPLLAFTTAGWLWWQRR